MASLFALLCFSTGCEEPLLRQYIKARNPDEFKTKAYELCGRHFRVLSYEEDTAKIECLDTMTECNQGRAGRLMSGGCPGPEFRIDDIF